MTKRIGGGYKAGGTYYLDVPSSNIHTLSSQVSPLRLHHRLGHPFIEQLKKIVCISS